MRERLVQFGALLRSLFAQGMNELWPERSVRQQGIKLIRKASAITCQALGIVGILIGGFSYSSQLSVSSSSVTAQDLTLKSSPFTQTKVLGRFHYRSLEPSMNGPAPQRTPSRQAESHMICYALWWRSFLEFSQELSQGVSDGK